MSELSRAPRRQANELPEGGVCEIVKLKNAHPTWGPRKIRALYGRKHQAKELPSESSFKRVLERAGLTNPRKRRRAGSDAFWKSKSWGGLQSERCPKNSGWIKARLAELLTAL